jgi:hypothetical protein
MALERLFSTDDVHPRDSFRRCREIVCDQLMFCELESYEDLSFAAKMECATIGPLGITAVAHGAMRLEVTQDALRRQRGGDSLYVALKRSGRAVTRQGEREALTGRAICSCSTSSRWWTSTGAQPAFWSWKSRVTAWRACSARPGSTQP